ncbi:hypothetical protein RF55_19714, partial [Lasius niger]
MSIYRCMFQASFDKAAPNARSGGQGGCAGSPLIRALPPMQGPA